MLSLSDVLSGQPQSQPIHRYKNRKNILPKKYPYFIPNSNKSNYTLFKFELQYIDLQQFTKPHPICMNMYENYT